MEGCMSSKEWGDRGIDSDENEYMSLGVDHPKCPCSGKSYPQKRARINDVINFPIFRKRAEMDLVPG